MNLRSGVFAGGRFVFDIEFPTDYPFKPPKFGKIKSFENARGQQTVLFHPLVSKNNELNDWLICEIWIPPMRCAKVLHHIRLSLESVAVPSWDGIVTELTKDDIIEQKFYGYMDDALTCIRQDQEKWFRRATELFKGTRIVSLMPTRQSPDLISIECITALNGETLLKLEVQVTQSVQELLVTMCDQLPAESCWRFVLEIGEDVVGLETIPGHQTIEETFGTALASQVSEESTGQLNKGVSVRSGF